VSTVLFVVDADRRGGQRTGTPPGFLLVTAAAAAAAAAATSNVRPVISDAASIVVAGAWRLSSMHGDRRLFINATAALQLLQRALLVVSAHSNSFFLLLHVRSHSRIVYFYYSFERNCQTMIYFCIYLSIVDTVRVVMRSRVYKTVLRPSVRLSVCPIYRPLQQRAAGLLLWAPQAGNIDRLLHGASASGAAAFRSILSTAARRSAANVSSVMSPAAVDSGVAMG